MAFGGFNQNNNARPVVEINMVPLIDVMLVLLIIFMITAPLMTHAVKIDLPKADSKAQTQETRHIDLAIAADGQFFWDTTAVNRDQLKQNLQKIAAENPQPELHVRADQNVPYRKVAEALADSAKAGVSRIGFVSEPEVSE
ncbi:biopolymer transporter ExbD [Methylomicrobium sp. Wu6]|uniref:ExbD/TolR family protein n=1 Tax=Methylomicrobium sp. Wu6 TaxID=3107928 RepID=UPI002DD65BA3|nr:biopolymer transporter ExbD [Methylomicrobium sp. Wu6]MEC4747198.1 biopolymer transporter ExbD [Methylomicrobium sp. Wu6]